MWKGLIPRFKVLLYYIILWLLVVYNGTTMSRIHEPKYTVGDIAYMEIMIIYIDVLAIGNLLK